MQIKRAKVCFAASSGGHFDQLMMLKPLMEQYESFIVTEETKYNNTYNEEKIYYLKQVNRQEKMFVFIMIINLVKSIKIFLKERPNIIVSTGVLAMVPLCIIVKITKGKLIYIESFAKVSSPTITGKFLYHFADRFYVQWESMLEIYPKAIYLGGIY